MSVQDLIAEIEKVRADTTLEPEAKKKALKKLRRQIRKSSGYNRKARSIKEAKVSKTSAVQFTPDEILHQLEEFIAEKGLGEIPLDQPGYAFSVLLASQEPTYTGIEVFFEKYRQRWGQEPTEARFLKAGKDTLFLLGPVFK